MKLTKSLVVALLVLVIAATSAFAQSDGPQPGPNPSQPEIGELRLLVIPGRAAQPSPEQLERFYERIWMLVGSQYLSVEALQSWGAWKDKYKGKLTTTADLDKALKEMTESLGDRWTTYTSLSDMASAMHQRLNGMTHLGLELRRSGDAWVVDYLEYGSPAQRSPLSKGDVVTAIGGKPLKARPKAEVDGLLLGATGTKVTVAYEAGGKESQVELEFAETPEAGVEAKMLADGIAYARLPHFDGDEIAVEFVNALHGLVEKGPVRGLVLDLRGNPGGTFETAVEVSSLFLTSGTVVSAVWRQSRIMRRETYDVTPIPAYLTGLQGESDSKLVDLLQKAPLVVLVDGTTMSAAELTTGALKDNGRARIVGTDTYGKGVAYAEIPLPNGAVITITHGKYLTPSGTDVTAGGIRPHRVVGQPRDGTDAQLAAAVAELKKLLR